MYESQDRGCIVSLGPCFKIKQPQPSRCYHRCFKCDSIWLCASIPTQPIAEQWQHWQGAHFELQIGFTLGQLEKLHIHDVCRYVVCS